MIDHLLPIGRFSQLCRLSIKTLRYYDEIGLLKPAHIDPWTNYRYYTVAQAAIADQIRLLRATDMPLEEVQLMLSTEKGEQSAIVIRHRQRLTQKIEEYQQALILFDQLQQHDGGAVHYPIELREITRQPTVAIRLFMPWSDLEPQSGVLFQEVMDYLECQQQAWAGVPAAVYYSISESVPEIEGGVDMEIAIPIQSPVIETRRIRNSAIPEGTAVMTTHRGSYPTISRAYQAIQAWMQAEGYESAGPMWESYLTNPQSVPDPADYHTEVYWMLSSFSRSSR